MTTTGTCPTCGGGIQAAVDPGGVKTLRELEALALDAALTATSGNRVAAAKLLGISHRTVYHMLDRYPAILARFPGAGLRLRDQGQNVQSAKESVPA